MMRAALFALLVAACGEPPCTLHEVPLTNLPSELLNGDCLGLAVQHAHLSFGDACDPEADEFSCIVITPEQLASESLPRLFVGPEGEYELLRALVPCGTWGCDKIRRAARAQWGDE